ncbi:MAG: lipid-A-disaccharide synthase [Betaproteobacteria bacterium RIFCSPLOWO2_02_FULL_65_24]|nr:MAG: lipid-A-disaccharide synthase [Betaproteobacteria bacterium RIFCSPLOWO2_02_FULL_65_24]
MLVGMVAGEASGDFLGAQLIQALRRRRPALQFAGIGGPKMQAAGLDSWYSMERLAVRGYVEVLRAYPGLLRLRSALRRRLLSVRPAVFIGVDAPDFNLTLEAGLKRQGVRTIHYVSPSIWAWRGGRIRRVAGAVDQLLALFPFEEPLYRRAGIPCTYVGHPLADAIPPDVATEWMRDQLKLPLGQRIYALLPGSRQSELRFMADTFIRTAQLVAAQVSDVHFLVPLASRETRNQFEDALYRAGATDLPATILFGHAREAMACADAVLVASGTASLEAALIGKPMVITYRMSPATWRLMSRMQYQPWVGLPNIIAQDFLVPELIQAEATPENLAQALINVSQDPAVLERLPQHFARMHALLRRDASERAAEAVLPWLAGR